MLLDGAGVFVGVSWSFQITFIDWLRILSLLFLRAKLGPLLNPGESSVFAPVANDIVKTLLGTFGKVVKRPLQKFCPGSNWRGGGSDTVFHTAKSTI